MRKLLDILTQSGHGFGFFDVVRLLDHALGEERIEFGHSPELTFPTSDVAKVSVEHDRDRGEERAHVELTFLGLLGTASPLSPEWSEEVLHTDDEGTLRAFYDVFHDRAASLLYSAWKSHSLEGGFDLDGTDPLSRRLRSLAGVDAWAPAEQDVLPPMVAVGLADHQRGQPQTIDVTSAEQLLRRLLPALNVRIQANVRSFVPFTPTERARLGEHRSRLGQNLVYGEGREDGESLIRLRVGPVDRDTYHSLMPGESQYERLYALTRRIFASAVAVELEVLVVSRDAPACALGKSGNRLGVDSRYAVESSAMLAVRVPLLEDSFGARRTFVLEPNP